MTSDGKWLEEQLNLSRIVDCGGEALGVGRETITVAAPYAVLKNAGIKRVDRSKGRVKGSGRVLNFIADYPTIENVALLGPMGTNEFLKGGGSIGSAVEGEHGIGIMGVTQATLRNVTIHNFYGDGLYFASRGGARNAKQNRLALLDNVKIYNTGRHSLTLTSMDGMHITGGCRLEFARRNPIDRETIHPVDVLRRITVDADTVRCNRQKRLRGRC